VIAADGQGPGAVLDGGPSGQARLIGSKPADEYVNVITAQGAVRVSLAGFPQLDLTAWVGRGKGADQAGQRAPARGQREADPQGPLRLPRGGACVLQGGQQLPVGWPPPVAQPRAERGEADPAGGPVEQGPAGFPLQRRYQPAHPGLGQAEPFGRPAEVKLVRHYQECLYPYQVHGRDLDSCPAGHQFLCRSP
jgi:hypothetical protein